jgi:hypothetical protein
MKLLLILLLAGCTAACGRGGAPAGAARSQPQAEPYPVPQRLYYDNGGGIQDSMRLVIRDEGTLRTRWEQATSRQAAPPPPPTVDFSREMAVLVAGGRMAPDDQVQVDSATVTRLMDEAGRMQPTLTLYVRTTRACRRVSADGYPLEILRVRRFDGPVRFHERVEQAEGCRDEAA